MPRYFRVIYQDTNDDIIQTGRFAARYPKTAAGKALTSIRKAYLNNLPDDGINFMLKEITRGSRKKYFYYNGKSIELKDPIKVQIGGSGEYSRTITYKYKSEIKKCTEGECDFLFADDNDDEKYNELVSREEEQKKIHKDIANALKN